MSAKITLITAVPGGGKSALMCSLAGDWIDKGRKVYVYGLNKPNFEHELLEDPRKWHEPGVVADGSIILIDEVQEVWRPSPSGAKIPADIAALEKHRHRGISFIITTQGPHLLHSNVKALVGQHIHLRNLGLLGRRYYEWQEIGDPKRFATAPISKSFSLPKKAFEMYTSASMHIKTPRTIPPALMAVGLGVLALGGLSWYAYKSIAGKVQAAQSPATPPTGASPTIGGPPAPRPPGRVLGVSLPVKLREPYAGVGVHLAGSVKHGHAVRSWFTLSIDGRAVATVQDAALQAAGYAVRYVAPCSVVLIFGELERIVLCDAPFQVPATRAVQPSESRPPPSAVETQQAT